jgi:hypothetical protein
MHIDRFGDLIMASPKTRLERAHALENFDIYRII